jgi:Flp pilus assembly protein TadG
MTAPNARERGSATVELALVTPALVAVLLFMVTLGRFATTRQDVDGAARDAARAASIARSPVAARQDAEAAANAGLEKGGVRCRDLTVDVDLADFRPGGNVVVDLTCSVDLSDVTLLRLPGSKTFSTRFVSVIDVYREAST